MTAHTQQDLIDEIVALTEGSPVHALRRQREKVLTTLQQSYQAFFGDDATQTDLLRLPQRLLIALYACRLTPAPALAAHYRDRLESMHVDPELIQWVTSGTPAELAALPDRRLAALLHFAHLLTAQPEQGTADEIRRLQSAKLDTPQVVLLAQMVAFLSYQTRVVAGLQALASLSVGGIAPSSAMQDHAILSNDALRIGSVIEANGFTNRLLLWRAWLDVVVLDRATAQQVAVLEATHPSAKTADYYLTLAHCPEILSIRSAAFNSVMYAPRGMSRADRELCALVTSRVNGCVYCCSVHSRYFESLAKRNDVVAQVYADPDAAGTSAREKALVAFAIELTRAPQSLNTQSVRRLSDVGFAELDVFDAIHATAMFAWANRLMLNLGEPFDAPQA